MPELPALGSKIVGYTKEGRPIIKNPDGSVSTERTVTFEVGGQWINVPTMFGGKEVDPEQALEIVRKAGFLDPDTKKPIPAFKSAKEAEKAAIKRSKALNEEMKALGVFDGR